MIWECGLDTESGTQTNPAGSSVSFVSRFSDSLFCNPQTVNLEVIR